MELIKKKCKQLFESGLSLIPCKVEKNTSIDFMVLLKHYQQSPERIKKDFETLCILQHNEIIIFGFCAQNSARNNLF